MLATRRPVLSSFQVVEPLAARESGATSARISLDLGLSWTRCQIEQGGLVTTGGTVLDWPFLELVSHAERRVFFADQDHGAVQVFSEQTGWMRTLCATEGAPTTLVSGVPMHRIKNTDPMRDTETKLQALQLGKRRGELTVLDTATGLGYTAIAASRIASAVVTIELDPAALELAAANPWSEQLFTSPKLKQIVGDSFEELLHLSPNSFSAVIHDPPTMSLGGELYSEEFYRRLKRVMKPGAALFHYVGDPKSHLGKRLYPGVQRRLAAAGFTGVKVAEAAHGVTATG